MARLTPAQLQKRRKSFSSAPRVPKPYQAEMFFTYEFLTTTALAPAGSTVLSVPTDQDGDFYWHKGCIFVDSANDGTTYDTQLCPNLTIQIFDGTTQRALSNAPVAASNYFGLGREPMVLSVPYYFAARALITMNVVNVSDNTTYSSIRISMHGKKAFL